MEITCKDLADLVGGHLNGDPGRIIQSAAGLNEAGEKDVSFIKDATKKETLASFSNSKAGVVMVPVNFSGFGPSTIEVEHPLLAFSKILALLENEMNKVNWDIHPTAVVATSAKLAARVAIGPYAVIEENAEIGEGARIDALCFVGARSKVGQETHLYPHVILRENVQIGDRCILHSGAVIGSDGYGFFFHDGRHQKIPQVGGVVIENDVEIGACTTVDRATTGITRIGKGTKVDNMVQVAHNVEIGEHSLLVAQVGIGGSSKIGRGVVIAGQAGVGDHVCVGDGTQIGGQSGVKHDTEPGSILWGTPAIPLKDKIKELVLLRQLPKLIDSLKGKSSK